MIVILLLQTSDHNVLKIIDQPYVTENYFMSERKYANLFLTVKYANLDRGPISMFVVSVLHLKTY